MIAIYLRTSIGFSKIFGPCLGKAGKSQGETCHSTHFPHHADMSLKPVLPPRASSTVYCSSSAPWSVRNQDMYTSLHSLQAFLGAELPKESVLTIWFQILSKYAFCFKGHVQCLPYVPIGTHQRLQHKNEPSFHHPVRPTSAIKHTSGHVTRSAEPHRLLHRRKMSAAKVGPPERAASATNFLESMGVRATLALAPKVNCFS